MSCNSGLKGLLYLGYIIRFSIGKNKKKVRFFVILSKIFHDYQGLYVRIFAYN